MKSKYGKVIFSVNLIRYLRIIKWSYCFLAEHWCELPQYLALISLGNLRSAMEFIVLADTVFSFYHLECKQNDKVSYITCRHMRVTLIQYKGSLDCTQGQALYWVPGVSNEQDNFCFEGVRSLGQLLLTLKRSPLSPHSNEVELHLGS